MEALGHARPPPNYDCVIWTRLPVCRRADSPSPQGRTGAIRADRTAWGGFGLTKLEALTVDPAQGERAWGLVVGRNPFICQTRLSAPRAVPALSPAILVDLRRAAAFFEQARGKAGGIEGDLRRRSLVQRRAFERHHLVETMFFAKVSSTVLDALRHGPKWAFRSRQPLQSALSA